MRTLGELIILAISLYYLAHSPLAGAGLLLILLLMAIHERMES